MSLIRTTAAMIALSAGAVFRAEDVGTSGSTAINVPAVPDGMKAEVFHFRKDSVKDSDGKVIEGMEVFKHPSVTIPLPIPTKEEVASIFADTSQAAAQKFILELISGEFYSQAREQINDARETNKENKAFRVSANVIDYSKLTINALATMPASERGNKVSEEDIKAFLADYVSVMPSAAQKDASKIKAQANLLEKGLRSVRTDKVILGIMDQMLSIWAVATSAGEDHTQVFEMLTGRIKRWTAAQPADLLGSIT